MAKRIAKSSIDWSRFAKLVPKEEKAMFTAFKSKSDSYLLRMLSYPEKPPSIDWNSYRKQVDNPAVVDQLEKAYSALSIPYPKDTVSALIDEQQKQNNARVEDFCADSQLKISEANKMIEKFKLMLPYEEMTHEDFALTFPDWSVRWQDPSVFPHWEKTPGLSREEVAELKHYTRDTW